MVDRAGFEPAASASFGWTCEGGVCTDDYAVVTHARLNYRPNRFEIELNIKRFLRSVNEMHKSEFSVVTLCRAVAQLGRASEPA